MKATHCLNILIVNNNPVFLKSLKNMIEEILGYDVHSIDYAFNEIEGIQLIQKKKFQLIFLDFDLKGVEKIVALRNSTQQQCKIVLISDHTEKEFIKLMTDTGAATYLNKNEIEYDRLAELFNKQNLSIISNNNYLSSCK